jgi:hypothetical protein
MNAQGGEESENGTGARGKGEGTELGIVQLIIYSFASFGHIAWRIVH